MSEQQESAQRRDDRFVIDAALAELLLGWQWYRDPQWDWVGLWPPDDPQWVRYNFPDQAERVDGRDHFMMPVLGMMDKLRRDWQYIQNAPFWQEVKSFFDGLNYEEQPFAISWFVRAIRIVDEDHPPKQADADAGILAARAITIEVSCS